VTHRLNGGKSKGRLHTLTQLTAAFALLVAAGCGSGNEFTMGSASGTVTYKEQPVKEGVLFIYNKETAYANQAKIQDGKFELPGEVRAGRYTVYLTPIPPAPGSPFDPVKAIGTGQFPTEIPQKYQFQDQSDLTIEIEEGNKEVQLVIPES
jgi:hypothetical protein